MHKNWSRTGWIGKIFKLATKRNVFQECQIMRDEILNESLSVLIQVTTDLDQPPPWAHRPEHNDRYNNWNHNEAMFWLKIHSFTFMYMLFWKEASRTVNLSLKTKGSFRAKASTLRVNTKWTDNSAALNFKGFSRMYKYYCRWKHAFLITGWEDHLQHHCVWMMSLSVRSESHIWNG